MLDWFWLILLFLGPVLLIPGLFIFARWLEKKFPALEKRISLSLWAGVLGLLSGLLNGEIVNIGGGFINLGRSADQGWPFYWFGADGLGLLGVPLALLGDIAVVALIAFAGFGIALVFNPILKKPMVKVGLYAIIVMISASAPALINLPKILENIDVNGQPVVTALEIPPGQHDIWVKKNAGSLIKSLQLEACSDFKLIPSTQSPGKMDMQFTLKLKDNDTTVRSYDIFAKILGQSNSTDNTRGMPLETDQALYEKMGENNLDFRFSSPYGFNVDKPGPYKIHIMIIEITLWYGKTGQTLDADDLEYAQTTLGLPGQNLTLECMSPPYTLEELGISETPTAQP